MSSQIRLSDLQLSDLNLGNVLERYKVDFDLHSTIGDNVYNYLTSKEGLIKHKRQVHVPLEKQHVYREAFRTIVSKGSPIIIYFSSFSPKVTNPLYTNHQFLPDMADLLTLVHLHLLAKHIRSFYDYGFRFIISFKGSLYQPIMRWSDEVVSRTFTILQDLIKHAERITGVRNVVEIVDFMDLVKTEGSYFQQQWVNEIAKVRNLYFDDDEYIERKIKGWIKDYKRTVDKNDFQDVPDFDSFMVEQALYIRALKDVQFRGGSKNMGLCNSLPPIVPTTIRGIDPELSLQINPFFRFHSHQRLLSFSQNQWKTFKWNELKDQVEPVVSEEYNYPFFYINQN